MSSHVSPSKSSTPEQSQVAIGFPSPSVPSVQTPSFLHGLLATEHTKEKTH